MIKKLLLSYRFAKLSVPGNGFSSFRYYRRMYTAKNSAKARNS